MLDLAARAQPQRRFGTGRRSESSESTGSDERSGRARGDDDEEHGRIGPAPRAGWKAYCEWLGTQELAEDVKLCVEALKAMRNLASGSLPGVGPVQPTEKDGTWLLREARCAYGYNSAGDMDALTLTIKSRPDRA